MTGKRSKDESSIEEKRYVIDFERRGVSGR